MPRAAPFDGVTTAKSLYSSPVRHSVASSLRYLSSRTSGPRGNAVTHLVDWLFVEATSCAPDYLGIL